MYSIKYWTLGFFFIWCFSPLDFGICFLEFALAPVTQHPCAVQKPTRWKPYAARRAERMEMTIIIDGCEKKDG